MDHFLHWLFTVLTIPVMKHIGKKGRCEIPTWHCNLNTLRRFIVACCHPWIVEAVHYAIVTFIILSIWAELAGK